MEIRQAVKYGIILIVAVAVFYLVSKRELDRKKATAEKVKAQPWYKTVIQEAKNYNLPPERVAAIVAKESGGNADARGAAGEFGLMQIMPGAHKEVQDHWARKVFVSWIHPDSDLMQPEYNILVGTTYLALLKERFKNLDKATEAYNDGGGYGTDYTDDIKKFEPYYL